MTDVVSPLVEHEAPDVLTRQQINQCLMDIDDLHPLRDRVRYYHILPCFKYCQWSKTASFDFELR